jgi:hypothetical protein
MTRPLAVRFAVILEHENAAALVAYPHYFQVIFLQSCCHPVRQALAAVASFAICALGTTGNASTRLHR